MKTFNERQGSELSGDISPADAAERLFRESPYHPIRRLTCRYCDGVLIIAGRLPSFYLKQLAQTAVQDLKEVKRVDNQVEVAAM